MKFFDIYAPAVILYPCKIEERQSISTRRLRHKWLSYRFAVKGHRRRSRSFAIACGWAHGLIPLRLTPCVLRFLQSERRLIAARHRARRLFY